MKLNFNNLITFVKDMPDPNSPYPGDRIEVEITKAWADIRTMQGREYTQSVLANTVETSRFIIRYIPDIDTSMQVKFKGQKYKIVSLVNDNEQNRTLTIHGELLTGWDS